LTKSGKELITKNIQSYNINTFDQLNKWCERASSSDFLSVDTEFKWEKTYWPQLCLIQVAIPDSVALVDPLSKMDLQPLSWLMTNPKRLKIFHAAQQDLEVFELSCFEKFTNLFDCQIAAALIGLDEQIGYGALVSKLLNIDLDKSQTRTDWTIRPLSAAQTDYAVNDVRYLKELCELMEQELINLGRYQWLQEDCGRLHSAVSLEKRCFTAWTKVKGFASLRDEHLRNLASLANWRERLAQKKNLPRSWVLRDSQLIELACVKPSDLPRLAKLLPGREAFLRQHGTSLIDAMEVEATSAWSDLSRPVALGSEERKWVKSKKVVIKERAKELNLTPSILCSSSDLTSIARGKIPARLSSGWRTQFLDGVLD
jgi:ribonuclease D